MDDPSPLIALYPPIAVNEKAIDVENEILDVLSFMNALYQFFRTDEAILKAKPDSKGALIATAVENFRSHFKDSFIRIPCSRSVQRLNQITFLEIPVEARAFMVRAGRDCCCKLVFPFSSASKPKDGEFVLWTLSNFGRVCNRLAPLWTLSSTVPALIPAKSAVLNQLMQSWDTDRPKSKYLCCLLMEIDALDAYRNEYLRLSDAQRANGQHPSIRYVFWKVSFVMSHLDPKWDRHTDASWMHRAIDDYLGAIADSADLRAHLFQETVDCIERVTKKERDLAKLERAMGTFDADDRIFVQEAIQNLKGYDATLFNPSSVLLGQLESADTFLSLMGDEDLCLRSITQPVPPPVVAPPVVINKEAAKALLAESNAAMCREAARTVRLARQMDSRFAADESLAEAGKVSDSPMDFIFEDEETAPAPKDAPVPKDEKKEEHEPNVPKKKKKAPQNQRRKLAKERQIQELSSILNDICDTVARETAQEIEHIAPMVQADILDELVHATVAEVSREMRTEIESIPLKAVMARAKAQTLPTEFARELVGVLLPGLENVLAPSIECFICYSTLDFTARPLGIRYLTCCAGGAFACPGCIATHTKRHALVAEERIVHQAASIRRQLKIGEFGAY